MSRSLGVRNWRPARIVGVCLLLAWCPIALAEKKHPAEEKGIKSVDNKLDTSLKFTNNTAKPVKLFWIDLEGKRKLYATIKPTETHQQGTFLGHIWLLTDEEDNALEIYTADAQPRSVALGAPPVVPKAGPGGGRGGTAASRGSSTLLRTLRDKYVQEDLRFDKERIARIEEVGKRDADARAALAGLSAAESRSKGTEITRTTDGALNGLLNAGEQARLMQINLQMSGTRFFSDTLLLEKLKLNAEQMEKFKKAQADFFAKSREAVQGQGFGGENYVKKLTEVRKATLDGIVAILNDEQKNVWNEVVGPVFTGNPTTFLAGFGDRGGGPPGGGIQPGGGFQPGGGNPAPFFSARNGASTMLRNLREKLVQEDLKLDKDRLARIEEIGKEDEKSRAALSGSAAQVRTQGTEITQKTEAALNGVLDAAQKKRLEQIVRQGSGSRLFTDAALTANLKLSAEQQAKMRVVQDEWTIRGIDILRAENVGTEGYNVKLFELRKSIYNGVKGFLTDEQKKLWDDLVGEPFRGQLNQVSSGPSGGFPSASDPRGPTGFGSGGMRSRAFAFNNWSCSTARFLSEVDVQMELKMTEEQIKKLGGGERTGSTQSAADILTPDQLKRSRGIYLQTSMLAYGPVGAFRYKEVLDELKLTDEQSQKILALGREDGTAYSELQRSGTSAAEKIRELDKATETKLMALLTDDQRAKYKAFLGEPFKGKISRPFGARP